MEERTLTIQNRAGLHARAAALFVQGAGKYASDLRVIKEGIEVNGKSIMGIMMLAASQGVQIIIVADGPDESELLNELEQLINDKFGEE